jgi:hypothetical protein
MSVDERRTDDAPGEVVVFGVWWRLAGIVADPHDP